MQTTQLDDADKLFRRALEALAAGEAPSALALLERALKLGDNPSWHSYLGYCIAKERGQLKKGAELCLAAQRLEPDNTVHYLNLAKVHQIAGQKAEALEVLRGGMCAGGSPEIISMLGELGNRKPPVLSFLSRDHFLNKVLGLIFNRMGLR
jgi:tetratricopeptide (TPR) repeat protein